MPFDPMTWVDGQFVTASVLDNDLYQFGGAYFAPNGIRFHSKKPLYKSFVINPGANITAGNWGRMYLNLANSAGVTADTGAVYGTPFDLNLDAQIQANVNGAGGGNLNGSPTRANGGLYLMSAFTPGGGASISSMAAGLGPQPFGTPTNTGSKQPGNNAHSCCPFVVDIVDGGIQMWTPYLFNGDASGTVTPFASTVPLPDGSGLSGKLQAQWASVYTAFGANAANAPAPLSSWSGQNLTAAIMNGNTGLRDVLRYFNQPPFMRISGGTGSLFGGVITNVSLGAMGAGDYDPYNGWNGSNTWTVPFTGLYLIHGIVGFQAFSGQCQAGIQVNGTNYMGPGSQMPSANQGTCTKTQIFSLNAGDTVRLVAQPSATASLASSWPTRLLIMHVSGKGTPGSLPVLPDTTYRWAAGQPGDLAPALNAHVANDLTLLYQKPYLMAYQATGQGGIAMGTNTTLQFDTVAGQVHGDNGDNYSGWNAGTFTYTSQRSGWYLAVMENCMIFPTLTSTPVVSALFAVTPNIVTNAWDTYQQQNCSLANFHGGATGLGYYYLRAGDTIKAGISTNDSSSTTTSTATGSNTTSHFELVWIGE